MRIQSVLMVAVVCLLGGPLLSQDAPVKMTDSSISRRRDNRYLDGRFTLHNQDKKRMSGLEVTIEFLDASGQPIKLQDLDGSMVAMAHRVTDLPKSIEPGKSSECSWSYGYLGTVAKIQARYDVKGTIDGKAFALKTEPESYSIPLWPDPAPRPGAP
ncbi:hypothetical protein DYH09_12030 [bacterium CPR1]|nr:hypothetical protein [bacterium CPR1]